jgi:hypothetical protein
MLLAIAYLKWLREGNVRMTFNSSTCSRLPRRLMTTLTQYGIDGREALAGVPAEEWSTNSKRKAMLDQNAPRSGREDGRGTRPDSPPVDSAGADHTTGSRLGVGDGADAIHLPAARVLIPVLDAEAPRNPEELPHHRHDKLGVGSLKKKCRDNLAAIDAAQKL